MLSAVIIRRQTSRNSMRSLLLLRRKIIPQRTLISANNFLPRKRPLKVVVPTSISTTTSRLLGHFSGKDPRIKLQAAASSETTQQQQNVPNHTTGGESYVSDEQMLKTQLRRFEERYILGVNQNNEATENKQREEDEHQQKITMMKELNTIVGFWLDYWRASGLTSSSRRIRSTLGPGEMLRWIDSLTARSASINSSTMVIRPDLKTFQHLLNGLIAEAAYTKTNDKGLLYQRSKLGELLLGRMLELVTMQQQQQQHPSSTNRTDATTTTTTTTIPVVNMTHAFNKVMTLRIQAKNTAAAEDLLRELVRLHDSEITAATAEEEERMFPLHMDSFTAVIGAYAKRGSPREAENVLIWMMQRASQMLADDDSNNKKSKKNDDILMPNKDAFETCLNAWVNANDTTAGQRAELVVLRMNELHEETRDTIAPSHTKPDVKSFSKVVTAWVKSKHMDATLRVDRILRLMHDDYFAENSTNEASSSSYQKTMIDMYVQVIKQWSLSGREVAPQKCKELLQKLDDFVEGGLRNVRPSKLQKMFASYMYAWSYSRDMDRTTQAEDIFEEMERNRAPGGCFESVEFWHHAVYDALLQTYSKAGIGHKAEWIFNKMLQEYLEHRDRRSNAETTSSSAEKPKAPDIKSINHILLAWSRSSDPEKAVHAQKTFGMITELGNTHNVRIQGDTTSYNALLASMAGTKKIDLARRGEQYFQQLKRNPSCKATTVSYNQALQMWANVRDPEALLKARALLGEMEAGDRTIWPDAESYKAFMSVLRKADLPEHERTRRMEYVQMRINAVRQRAPYV